MPGVGNLMLRLRRPTDRSSAAQEAPSVTAAVAQFAAAGLIALAVFLAGSLFVLRDLGRSEALRDARQFAVLTGQGIVEPEVSVALLAGDRAAIDRIERIVQERVLGERIVRIKIWTRDGQIVYSDEPRLIGSVHPLETSKLDVLRTGRTRAELSDLAGPENRFERGQGDLYEVYLPIRTPDGTPLLFETYQRGSSVSVDRTPDLASIRRAPARQPRPPLARPGAAGLATRGSATPQPARARSPPRSSGRGVRRRAQTDRGQPP